MPDKALIIVDVQNDFCSGGTLPVPDGDKVVSPLNLYIAEFMKRDFLVVASRDWHPPETKHFSSYGGIWPVHCVKNTQGGNFHPELLLPKHAVVISKGMDPDKDSYSAFQGEDEQGRNLQQILQEAQVKEIYIGGLATDYCVKASCLDGLLHHWKVFILNDAIRGVDIHPGDSDKAIEEMRRSGAIMINFEELPFGEKNSC